jgi:hypothetical protein
MLSGCALVPLGEGGAKTANAVGSLDSGAVTATGEHVQVSAYSDTIAHRTLKLAESIYEDAVSDAGLQGMLPRGRYSILVYTDKHEMMEKGRVPDYAEGALVQRTIVTHQDPVALTQAITHFICHAILRDYLNRREAHTAWIEEGYSIYLERRVSPRTAPEPLSRYENPIAIDQLTDLPPIDERHRKNETWFRQAGDLVEFMIDRGGRIGFSDFMSRLRSGDTLDEAIGASFPNMWHNMQELEQEWNQNRA